MAPMVACCVVGVITVRGMVMTVILIIIRTLTVVFLVAGSILVNFGILTLSPITIRTLSFLVVFTVA
jgi:hypothetical protein